MPAFHFMEFGGTFWLQFADNGLGSVSTNNRNISTITTTSNPYLDVILETPFASRLCLLKQELLLFFLRTTFPEP
jgi:hypothetical protein